MRKKKVLFVFGTRPETIKLAPVILAMKMSKTLKPVVCVTAQHRQMLDQVLEAFGIRPEHDLGIMRPGQSLSGITALGLAALEPVIGMLRPSMVVVQGDTTSTLIGALAAFYARVPIGHVEAGLRTGNKYEPYPEEINRRLTGHMADLHWAPTVTARENLIKEGIAHEAIIVTGNTAVDALLLMRERVSSPRASMKLRAAFPFPRVGAKMILVTAHRRESFGEGMKNICRAIRRIAEAEPGIDIVYPVHMNPNVRGPVGEILSGMKNVHLIEPAPYDAFVYLMTHASVILTDSGGVQEEAPSLGVPVAVMRDVTERPEAVSAGVSVLVGTDEHRIANAAIELLHASPRIVGTENPYGDGHAAERIISEMEKFLS